MARGRPGGWNIWLDDDLDSRPEPELLASARRAIMNVCLHLGGPLDQVDGGRLMRAWHNATWALRDGAKLAGPGRWDARLMTLPTRIIDGVLHYVYGTD